MSQTRFTVRHRADGSPWFWLTVVVHDTTAELQAAALRPSDVPGFWDNCAGCFQPHTGNLGSGYLGIMKAIHLNPYSKRSMNEREEVMAHAVNGIACALLKHLQDSTC